MPDSARIEDLRRRVQSDPASIAFAQLAEEYRRARKYQDSVEVCQTGLRVHPRYLSARVTLGRALIELGRLDEARDELVLVVKSEPRNLAAIRALAETHRRRGAWSEALEQYRAALQLASNDPDLERAVTELTSKTDHPDARAPEAASAPMASATAAPHAPPPSLIAGPAPALAGSAPALVGPAPAPLVLGAVPSSSAPPVPTSASAPPSPDSGTAAPASDWAGPPLAASALETSGPKGDAPAAPSLLKSPLGTVWVSPSVAASPLSPSASSSLKSTAPASTSVLRSATPATPLPSSLLTPTAAPAAPTAPPTATRAGSLDADRSRPGDPSPYAVAVARDRERKVLASLEQWLVAIHGARTNRRA